MQVHPLIFNMAYKLLRIDTIFSQKEIEYIKSQRLARIAATAATAALSKQEEQQEKIHPYNRRSTYWV